MEGGMDGLLPPYTESSFHFFMFDWHHPGCREMAASRGIAQGEAATVYADTASSTIRDPRHPGDSNRFITVGFSYRRLRLAVFHTDTVEMDQRRNEPQTLLIRIDDMRELAPADDLASVHLTVDDADAPEVFDLSDGTRGRYAAL